MKNLQTLVENVEQWSKDKELDTGSSHVQHTKMIEEVGEVASALCRNEKDDFKEKLQDGIGDVMVTLIILAQQNDMNINECLDMAWNEIKDRKGKKNKDGGFVKEQDL